MRVKVCGMTRSGDVELAVELGAWAVGLVLAPRSPRRLSVEQARRLRASVPVGVLAVGVFQAASREDVIAAVKSCRLDAVQLHGARPEACSGFSVPAYLALGVPRAEIDPVHGSGVAGVLVEPVRSDADRRKGRVPGLAAQRAAWRVAREFKGKAPMVILAGGLTPENVAEAIAAAGPDGVDVSSGVEWAPGLKDPAKMRAFFQAVKAASRFV